MLSQITGLEVYGENYVHVSLPRTSPNRCNMPGIRKTFSVWLSKYKNTCKYMFTIYKRLPTRQSCWVC